MSISFARAIHPPKINGFRFTANEEDAANAVIALAAGGIDEDGYDAFPHANVQAAGAT